MKCKACGTNNPESNKFCLNCGEKIEERVCPNCGQELSIKSKFCGNCGEKSPFFKESIDENSNIDSLSNKSFKDLFVKNSSLIQLIFFIIVALFTFGISFTSISSTTFSNWVEVEDDYENISFPVRQDAIQYYKAYFSVIGISDQAEMSEFYDELNEQASDIDLLYDESDSMTSKDYSKAFSNINFTSAIMADKLDFDNPFLSTIQYFIVLILLFVLQLLPLIILVIALYYYLIHKKIIVLRKLFLIAGLTGITLSFFLPNMVYKTSAGWGLLIYIIFMIMAFTILEIIILVRRKKFFNKKTYMNIFDLIVVIVILILSFGSFVQIGYEETPTKTYWGSSQLNDSFEMIGIYNDDFQYDDSYRTMVPDFNDPDLTRSDKINLAKTSDYHYIFYTELFNEDLSQHIFINLIIFFSLMLFISGLVLFYKLLNNLIYNDRNIIHVLKFLVLFSSIVLLILSIISSVKIDYLFYLLDMSFTSRISFGLIIGIVLSIISIILSFSKPKILEPNKY